MRHLKRTAKLGRTGTHRNAMLANMVCSLIIHRRITTTLAKARAARSVAEKMLTLGKKSLVANEAAEQIGDADKKRDLVAKGIHYRRLAASRLHQEDAVKTLFKEIAPLSKERIGGYTRIIKLGQRRGDAASMAILEWIDAHPGATTPAEDANGNEEALKG
jgi:large subunit ribosomal protein L17